MKSDELVSDVLSKMTLLKSDQMDDFISTMTATMILVMRGNNGDEFTNDYLVAALNDRSGQKITPKLLQ